MKDKYKNINFDISERPKDALKTKGRLIWVNTSDEISSLYKTAKNIMDSHSMKEILAIQVFEEILNLGYKNAQEAKADNNKSNKNINRGSGKLKVAISTVAFFAVDIKDDMSFQEAFGTARNELGPGAFFEWNENVYSTYYQEEWQSIAEDQKENFWNSIIDDIDSETLEILDDTETSKHDIGQNPDINKQIATPVDNADDLDLDSIPEALDLDDNNTNDFTDVIEAELDFDNPHYDLESDWEDDSYLDLVLVESEINIKTTEVELKENFKLNMDEYLEVENFEYENDGEEGELDDEDEDDPLNI